VPHTSETWETGTNTISLPALTWIKAGKTQVKQATEAGRAKVTQLRVTYSVNLSQPRASSEHQEVARFSE